MEHYPEVWVYNTAAAESFPADREHFALRAEFPGFQTRRELEMIDDKRPMLNDKYIGAAYCPLDLSFIIGQLSFVIFEKLVTLPRS